MYCSKKEEEAENSAPFSSLSVLFGTIIADEYLKVYVVSSSSSASIENGSSTNIVALSSITLFFYVYQGGECLHFSLTREDKHSLF
jgi:hypothetical protein